MTPDNFQFSANVSDMPLLVCVHVQLGMPGVEVRISYFFFTFFLTR